METYNNNDKLRPIYLRIYNENGEKIEGLFFETYTKACNYTVSHYNHKSYFWHFYNVKEGKLHIHLNLICTCQGGQKNNET